MHCRVLSSIASQIGSAASAAAQSTLQSQHMLPLQSLSDIATANVVGDASSAILTTAILHSTANESDTCETAMSDHATGFQSGAAKSRLNYHLNRFWKSRSWLRPAA